ncbi:MAG: sensor histidine kinase [Gemmiger sp.]|uniref:sensor histidine kinase n=1 Tax=Gemmiger sp. TaxID=2049027 RepID=UPI0026651C5E|nr:sensor histidine kinase [Gemmiger sp.]MEE0709068.1 sensor histidine kinase [Gemmiger sp.]
MKTSWKALLLVVACIGCIILCVRSTGTLSWIGAAGVLVCLAVLGAELYCCSRDMENLMQNGVGKTKMCSSLGRRLEERLVSRENQQQEQHSAQMMDSQSQLNALQNQINPHFLYNTLECIRSEALLQDCGSIAEMSHALASFFRYSISRRENIVTVEDELRNIHNYFFIQQFRFGNRFALDVRDLEDGTVMDCLIPKMTMQPVVENCIFHGLEPKASFGHVTITLDRTETLLRIVISDDGVGMSPETLDKMRRSIRDTAPVRPSGSSHGNGIAMHNVNQRIKLIYGAEYGMQIYSTQNVGTDVEILLPLVWKKEELTLQEAAT